MVRQRLLHLIVALNMFGLGFAGGASAADDSVLSAPKDTTPYARLAVAEDYTEAYVESEGNLVRFLIVDAVVSNTDPTLNTTDTFNDGEPSMAVNPQNRNEIVITTFAGSSGTNAALWHSLDEGVTWTKRFTIPSAPGVAGFLGCPGPNVCDQTVDYGRGNQMSGAFLDSAPDVYSGTTTNPASAAAWNWFTPGGVTQRTNNNVPATFALTDQPWLLVNRDVTTASQDDVYVAYDHFTNGLNCVGNACNMRVAVSYGLKPPQFTVDNQSGTATGSINPGHRLAVDRTTGFVYSLFQRNIAAGVGGSKNIDYMLNRSIDGGATWILNGSAGGIIVANADSTQPTPKFGTVNALLGGVLHAAVDPTTGDVYYVYGNRDGGTGNNRLAIRRIRDDGAGGVIVGGQSFVTGQVQAALPSVAVTIDGTVGVFYYTFDDFSAGFPMFSTHLALSRNQGVTFTDNVLQTFLSSAADDGNARQRVFGDYVQMKALGCTFYGAFTANGVTFGRPVANHDPIFFRADVSNPLSVVSASVGTAMLKQNDHILVNVGLAASATDGACQAPTSFTVQVFSNEDDQGPTGENHFSPDAKDIGIGTLRLRQERLGAGDGRVYLIVIKATDTAGGTGFATATVVVPKSSSPADVALAKANAAAAKALADANNGTPPTGYFVVGDGPVVGPKQ